MSLDVASQGYVSAEARPSVATRARRSPLLFVGVALFIAILAVLITQSKPADYTYLSTDNSSPNGTRALAQILRSQGVEVRQAGALAEARVGDPASTTLVIADPYYLSDAQLRSIANYPGDIVFLGTSQAALDVLDSGLTLEYTEPDGSVDANCTDPDATAAEQIMVNGDAFSASPASPATTCFTDVNGNGSYATLASDIGKRAFLANPDIATNELLDQQGNAALTLRITGAHESAVWYVGNFGDTTLLTWGDSPHTPTDVPASPDFLPPGTMDVLFALGIVVLITAFWRARRFGPLVTEPLPVIVRSSEATRGRARLYRRARATGRSGAALRAHAALRIGQRLGVPRSAGQDGLVTAIARATGRSTQEIASLLYGPPPSDDAGMIDLVHQLDTLESEVHRP